MTTTETPAPDLSRLSREDRIRIAVAVTQGATWVCLSVPDGWWNVGFGPSIIARLYRGEFIDQHLPRYLSDPAAWGALMERERICLAPQRDGRWAAWRWFAHEPLRIEATAEMLTPGEAICAAVLAKHGMTVD